MNKSTAVVICVALLCLMGVFLGMQQCIVLKELDMTFETRELKQNHEYRMRLLQFGEPDCPAEVEE